MHEVVLDTETTGLDPAAGHRVVEIGCVELLNHLPTGRTFHAYVNPERDMPEDAHAVHGLTAEFLAGHPTFDVVAEDFLAFLGDRPLVIHNAAFDLGFLNAELERVGRPAIAPARAIDTVRIAREKFPGAPANLDALCKRFGIDNSARSNHGALLDAGLLAEVYLDLIDGRQPGLTFAEAQENAPDGGHRPRRAPRPHAPTPEEEAAHAAFVERLTDPVWRA